MTKNNNHADKIRVFLIGAILLCFFFAPVAKSATVLDQVGLINRNRLSVQSESPLYIGMSTISGMDSLNRFYTQREFKPVWMNNSGLLPIAEELIRLLDSAFLEGLKPSDYHLNEIRKLIPAVTEKKLPENQFDPTVLADLELLLSDAFLDLGSHLLSGRINPELIEPEWMTIRRHTDLVKILNQAVLTKQIAETLDFLRPSQVEYFRLKEALQTYRTIALEGGWGTTPALKKGRRSKYVIKLRHRLYQTGDLVKNRQKDNGDTLFDKALASAVSRFQLRHGLRVNGRVDEATRHALNIPVEERITQLIVNLERWRWLPRDLGNPHIQVNIPNFELRLIEGSNTVLKSRVIVGSSARRTPIFSNMMTFLILNPFWYIPNIIASDDMLHLVKKDPGYLARKHIRLYNSWEENTVELDPLTIDWQNMTQDSFQYLFIQDPGTYNALGAVKFMFPNTLNIYLHDTPNKKLFKKSSRDLSSGCVR
ncbi:L,D-transpeptidase family protein, partial [bacterium]|nr:L,D-transpeptidase family protein [bacterium]